MNRVNYMNSPPNLYSERYVRRAIWYYLTKKNNTELYYDITYTSNDARIVVSEMVDGKKKHIETVMALSYYNLIDDRRPAVPVGKK